MSVTVDAVRAVGARRVTLRTDHGDFDGRVVQERLGSDAVILLFARDGDLGEPLVVPLDSVATIVER